MYKDKAGARRYARDWKRHKRLKDPAYVERERAINRRSYEKRCADPTFKQRKAVYDKRRRMGFI